MCFFTLSRGLILSGCLLSGISHSLVASSDVITQSAEEFSPEVKQFLFTYYDLPDIFSKLHKPVQHMIARYLQFMAVGHVKLGRANRDFVIRKLKKKDPSLFESVLTATKSVVNYVAPRTFIDEYKRGMDFNVKELFFTRNDTHIIYVTWHEICIVNLDWETGSRFGEAHLVDLCEEQLPGSLQPKVEGVNKRDPRRAHIDYDCSYWHDYDAKSGLDQKSLYRVIHNISPISYHIMLTDESPHWEKRGDLKKILQRYEVTAYEYTEDHKLYVTVDGKKRLIAPIEEKLVRTRMELRSLD